METRLFSLGQILSITTDIFCTPNFGDVYEILNYMTGDSAYTHQLKRFADECRPYLLEQHPFLSEITAEMVEGSDCLNKVKQLEITYGALHAVRPIHQEDHEKINPLTELKATFPDVKIIEFNLNDTGDK